LNTRTNEAAHRTAPGSSALRESEATATKRQSERKSITRFGNSLKIRLRVFIFLLLVRKRKAESQICNSA